MQIYTPIGTYQSAWRPTISASSFPGTVNPGSVNNSVFGTQFNGISQGASYGDDAQSATNYPLVGSPTMPQAILLRAHAQP